MTKDRPILFNAEMVRATLAGRKTQTRRLNNLDTINQNPDRYAFDGMQIFDGENYAHFTDLKNNNSVLVKCPHGQPGDRLWVRENFSVHNVKNGYQNPNCWDNFECPSCTVKYPADDGEKFCELIVDPDMGLDDLAQAKRAWNKKTVPSIHMPLWASRITLEITDIRVERLQDISKADAIREGAHVCSTGLPPGTPPIYGFEDYKGDFDPFMSSTDPVQAFRGLWININGLKNWNENPWVWVVEFKHLKGGAK